MVIDLQLDEQTNNVCGSAALRAERLCLSGAVFYCSGYACDFRRRHSLGYRELTGKAGPFRREGGRAARAGLRRP